jgi:hypothetical protein
MAMLSVCQVPKVLSSVGAQDSLKGALEGLSCVGEHRLSLACQNFLGHLGHCLVGQHGEVSLRAPFPAHFQLWGTHSDSDSGSIVLAKPNPNPPGGGRGGFGLDLSHQASHIGTPKSVSEGT